MCSKPGVGSLRLQRVAEARCDNPTVVVNHGFNDLDGHVSVDSVRWVIGIFGVLHELLDPLRWEADFHGNPRTHAVPRRAVVRGTRLCGEFQPIGTLDGTNLSEAVLRRETAFELFRHVRGVEQVSVQVKRYDRLSLACSRNEVRRGDC